MACFAFNGEPPNPPRVWSRVQGNCTIPLSEIIYIPETNTYTTYQEQIQINNKGNILQYKKNSSNITKQQRYSQIARGRWTNRTTTWASQTITTTIPNTQNLQRVNYKTIYQDTGAPANLPITCPPPITSTIPSALPTNPNRANQNIIQNELPLLQQNIDNGYVNICPIYVNPPEPPAPQPIIPSQQLPDKPINPIIVPTLPVINPPPQPIAPVVIPDGGNLLCNTRENICTGEISSTGSINNCNPTSASDVPGPIIDLCYDDSLPTYYPRNRYIMTNSGNKFPVGYKFTPSN